MPIQFQTKTAAQYRDDFLRSVRNALITVAGISNPNVSYGTDHYIIGEAIGKIAELASYNAIAAANAQMADSATGEDLYRIAAIYGLSLRPAGGSTGYLTLSTSATVGVVSGQQLLDPTGLKYQVSVGGTYANGATIPVSSIDTGSGTNLAVGTVLRWVSPPAYVAPTALVYTGGLTGGADAESDEDLRARLLSRLRNPIGGGNWAQFADAAETSSVAVQKAFVYPAFNGPSTVLVSVLRAPTDTNKERDVDSLVVSGTVKPAVQAVVFEGIDLVVTTVQNVDSNVSIGLSLPTATTAVPAGPGGGWLDGNPFPYYDGNASDEIYSPVYSVTSTTVFSVYSNYAPTAGVTRIVYINPSTWDVYHAKVSSYVAGPVSDTYTITVDTPCVGITAGHWVSPDALKMDSYIDALLDVFGQLGPGQLTNSPALLPYGYRRPLVTSAFASDLGPSVLKFISNVGDEVLDVEYFHRSITSPAIPADVHDGPNILVPANIGFYPL